MVRATQQFLDRMKPVLPSCTTPRWMQPYEPTHVAMCLLRIVFLASRFSRATESFYPYFRVTSSSNRRQLMFFHGTSRLDCTRASARERERNGERERDGDNHEMALATRALLDACRIFHS
jgi:hypothetical protein